MELVGRDAELSVLRDALADARAGRGGLVLVSGAAGMGKTALLAAFADEAAKSDAVVLWGSGWESGGAPAYWPWTQALRRLVHRSGPEAVAADAGRLAHLLPELGAPASASPGSSAGARFALFDAVAGALLRAAAAQPLVVVLDDLHVAGGPAALLLQFLAREARWSPILLVAAYRPVEATWDAGVAAVVDALGGTAVALPLPGLDAEGTAELVRRGTRSAPPAGLVAAVRARTAGNPLFVTEVARLLAGGVADPGAWSVPAGIRQAIRARVERLRPPAPDVLAAAAVLGREFELPLLAALTGVPAADLLEPLETAAAAELVAAEESGRYRFAHDLIRDTLHEDLAPHERARGHAAATRLLARRDDDDRRHLATLAHHALAALPLLDGAVVAGYAERAAAHAARMADHDRAAELYTGALAALDHADPADAADHRGRLLVALGDALIRAGGPQRAHAVLDDAAELARRRGDAVVLARAALVRAERLEFNDVDTAGVALLEEAAAAVAGSGGALEARVLARLAVAGYHTRADGDGLADRAVTVARASGDEGALAQALSARLHARWGSEPAETVRPVADEIVTLAERGGDRERAVEGRLWRLVTQLEQGELGLAEREVHAIERHADALRQPLHRLMAVSRRSTLAFLRGRMADALELARRAREIGERGHEPDADAVYWGQAFAVGRFVELPGEDAARAERIVRDLVARSTFSLPHAAGLVMLCLDGGREQEARARYDAIVRRDLAALPRDMVHVWSLAQLAPACVAFGDARTAAVLHAALLPSAGRCAVAAGGVACSGAVDLPLGLLAGCAGRPDEAVAHLERAVELHARMGAPALLAASRLALAAALQGREPEQARAQAAAARAAAVELGLTRLLPAADPAGPPSLVREGGLWSLRWNGRRAHLTNAAGLHYLAALLGAPGRELRALDLLRARGPRAATRADATDGLHADLGAPAGDVLDARARAVYRARLAELRAEQEEARDWNDPERAARRTAEIDALLRELGAALSRGGRPRRVAGDAERARISVTRALRAAIARIAEVDAEAGAHLAATVRTGTYCCYRPERG